MPMYHNGNRELQSLFGSTALADRLEQRLRHSEFTEDDKTFIESLDYFFLATATPVGQPDCSFKGGPPGFVTVLVDTHVAPRYALVADAWREVRRTGAGAPIDALAVWETMIAP